REIIPWPDLPESRRQEYLATAKAVLPEIVGEVLGEAANSLQASCDAVPGNPNETFIRDNVVKSSADFIRALRDRRLEELE
ncbi:hypothetical protein LCGC14_3059700, partial [marine sediment metagenome]